MRKLLGRVHDKEEAVALRVGTIEMRDVMLEAEPQLFYITDHYKPCPLSAGAAEAADKTTLKDLVQARIGEIEAMREPAQSQKSRRRKGSRHEKKGSAA